MKIEQIILNEQEKEMLTWLDSIFEVGSEEINNTEDEEFY